MGIFKETKSAYAREMMMAEASTNAGIAMRDVLGHASPGNVPHGYSIVPDVDLANMQKAFDDLSEGIHIPPSNHDNQEE